MTNVLVTGGQGQLAKNIKDLESQYNDLRFLYKGSIELDITDIDALDFFFKTHQIAYCINCAAYTQVDNAETEEEKAMRVNGIGVKNLALICSRYNAIPIHISTDFVFDGNTSVAYAEVDDTNPLGVYGFSKLRGEKELQGHYTDYFIIRTSWLYSEHGSNFLKTMIKLSMIKEKLGIVDDQIGTPTYAKDLADLILKIIETKTTGYGTYHYSNEGVASWYDFAQAIFDETEKKIKLFPIKTKDYPTLATRPTFSVLDKSKIKANLNIEIPHWHHSLKKAIFNLNRIQK